MRTQKTGVIGLGYIGNAHIESLQRLGVEVAAVADSNPDACQAACGRYSIAKRFAGYRELIERSGVDVVHVCTPNHLHYEIAKYAIGHGKHVLCEKPLSMNSEQSAELTRLARAHGVCTAVNFNYRYYPVVQHARQMAQSGEFGRVNVVQGCYLQDWLLYDTDYNWRLEPEIGGLSRAIADIGSHWCDLAQFISGQTITEVMADLKTVHPIRKKPAKASETFSSGDSPAVEDRPMSTEDWGAVLVRFNGDARGVFSVSQVSAGRKCKLRLEVYGAQQSLMWDHERANELWIGHRDRPNEILMKDPTLLNESGRRFAHYPGGHPEGYPSAVMNLFEDFYNSMDGKSPAGILNLPGFAGGHDQVLITEAILESNRTRRWVRVERENDAGGRRE